MQRVLRYSEWDAVLIALSFAYAALLLSAPSIPLVAIGLWWTANTVAHNFIHTPFFRPRALNRGYALFLTVLMGVPQSLWRGRHLRHHRQLHSLSESEGLRPSHSPTRALARRCAGALPPPLKLRRDLAEALRAKAGRSRGSLAAARSRDVLWTSDVVLEAGVVLSLWAALAAADPRFFLGVYVPGYAAGLGLCALQGHFEHARGTTSHYGWLYNWCFFNDGYHAEHHLRPGDHWTRLPSEARVGARGSRWPPVLRWLDAFSLDLLERAVLRSPRLQRFVLAAHARAFERLLQGLPAVHRVTIVGGGLFPRSALILRRLLPDAALTIVDAKREHLDIAATFLHGGVELQHRLFDPDVLEPADLVVIPLAFIGDRDRVYRRPPAKVAVVHDWMWRPRAGGARISWLLLKRLNLVTR